MSDLREVVVTKSRLLALPGELKKNIIDVLDIPSKLALRITSRDFFLLIKPATHKDLMAIEKSVWAIQRGLYTCMDCTRLRPSCKFADAMRKGSKGLNGKKPHRRFCIDCGLHPKLHTTRYSPGAEITVNDKRYVLCKKCRNYTANVVSIGSGLCGECHPLPITVGPSRRRSSARKRWRRDYEDDFPWEDMGEFWEYYDPS
jgi:hypothetical protein